MSADVRTRTPGVWRFWVYSAVGIFMFFVPLTLAGKNTIPLDHLVTGFRAVAGPVVPWIALAIIAFGTVRPFATGLWRASRTRAVFAFLNIAGLAVALALVLGFAPGWLAAEDIGPFLFDSLVIPVGLIVPIGAIFLALLVGYGLLEYIGVLMQPVMRPVWRTPGRSAVDAVASFVGSYSLGLLITNRIYREGKYSTRDAAIIATGFSTVSVTFMVIVATTLDLMDRWLLYFFVSLVVTFAVTAVTTRIPPLSRMPETFHPDAEPNPEEKIQGSRFAAAWAEARGVLATAPGLLAGTWASFKEGLVMASSILPSILSVGLGGLLLAKFTPIFDWLSYLLLPFTWIVQLPDPALAAKAMMLGIVEMFLPAVEAAGHESEVLRFVVAVVCVSGVIFLSAMVPSLLATDIPFSLWTLFVIWYERVVLSIILTTPLAFLLL